MSIFIAFIVYYLLGALWFTIFFKKQYAISLGKENQLPQKPAPIFIIGPAICSLVITIATALLMHVINIITLCKALEFSLIIGIGFLVANTINIAINPNMPRPIHYGIISGFYHLTGIILVCFILVMMQ
ncbi:MAG: DUF1761 domain-containing protein [Chitinophagales bacterium]